jgi:integrase
MPRYITNQKLNRYIKEACRAAGIVEQVVTVRISAGRRVEERHAKYELVTTHTARRSFATNEYLRAIREGRDWRPIMAITGHKKESQFFDYIRITSEENAVLFSRQRGAKAG